jgi:phage terminase large subunit
MFQLNPNLRDFWATRKPYKLLKGGRFSSKTHDAGGMAVYLARNYSVKFLCIRQFQNRISDSVYTVIKQKIEEAGWMDEFNITASTIRHKETGSDFLFYGMARNLNDIKGTEGVDVCWIEEGEGLTKDQWLTIDPTIRGQDGEAWIIWNPQLKTDFVQSKLPELLGDDCIIRHINYLENPFLSDSARAKAERLKVADPDAYDHIYLGQPITNDDAAIIKYSWIESAVDAHLTLNIDMSGEKAVGYDVADSGKDKNATVSFDGAICHDLDEWSAGEDELTESALRAWSKMPAKRGRFIYDAIGVGAHTGSTLKGANQKRRVFKFLAGGAVMNPDEEYSQDITNKDKFENLKAQSWADVADRFRNTYNAVTKGQEFKPSDMISISSDLPKLNQLKLELSTPRRRFSKRGLDMVETKDQLKARDVDSPNLADAFIMGACPHLISGAIFDYSKLT